MIQQTNQRLRLKKLGTVCAYKCPPRNCDLTLSVLVFSDAGRTTDHCQLCFIAGLLIGDMTNGSIIHTVSWSSRKSKRPVKSVGAAEILAAGEAIDEGKLIAQSYSMILGFQLDLIIVLDSKDLFYSLSTQRNSIDKSIRANVNVIRHEFEIRNVHKIIWIPGNLNLADPGTKCDSPLSPALQLMLFSGKLPSSFPGLESCTSDRSLG